MLFIPCFNGYKIISDTNTCYYPIIWEFASKEPFFNRIIPGNYVIINPNNIYCYNDKDCYTTLTSFFSDCNSPKDFFNSMQQIKDAFIDTDKRSVSLKNSTLMNLCNSTHNEDCSMCCVQQILVLIYGVMASFSAYDNESNTIILEPSYGHFNIEIWRSFDLNLPIYPWRSHHMIVIDKWNGEDFFVIDDKIVDKILFDTWINKYKEWDLSDIFFLFRPKYSFQLFTRLGK